MTANISSINYSDYIKLEMIKGDESYSAPVEFLAFNVKVLDFKPRELVL